MGWRKENHTDTETDELHIKRIHQKDKEIQRIVLETREKRLEALLPEIRKSGNREELMMLERSLNDVGVAIDQINPPGYINQQYCSKRVKDQIIERLALGWTISGVVSWLNAYYAIAEVNFWQVKAIRNRNRSRILQMKLRFQEEDEPSRFMEGKNRIKELEDLYQECRKQGEYSVARAVMKLLREEIENSDKELDVNVKGAVATSEVNKEELKEMALVMAAKKANIPLDKIVKAKRKIAKARKRKKEQQ
jgi:hypothetical protein